MTEQQMQEIRRGILLAKHDIKVQSIREKYKDDPSGILTDWLGVYDETERLIIGESRLTRLTMRAYHRALNRMSRKSLNTKGTAYDTPHTQRGFV